MTKLLLNSQTNYPKQTTILFKAVNDIKNNPYNYKKNERSIQRNSDEKTRTYPIIFDINDKNNQIFILDIGKRSTI